MRIAIIEDDEITRLELSKLLNTQGYETVLLTDFGNLTDELKQYSIELRWNLSRGFSAKHNVSENSVQNICRAVSPQRMRIIGSMVFFYL